jgi:hypothetical protein
MLWIVEPKVFGSNYDMPRAIEDAGHDLLVWNPLWDALEPDEADGLRKVVGDKIAVFHGSIGNADKLFKMGLTKLFDADKFACSSWYPHTAEWRLNQDFRLTTVKELIANPPKEWPRVFVRPDSALKPFAGRVLDSDKLTLASLDHGFYYDDINLPVMVSPAKEIQREWRFVVANKRVVAGSEYVAEGRVAKRDPFSLAMGEMLVETIASTIPAPDLAYVMDVCETMDGLRLVEINPFGGADLYNCKAASVVEAIAEVFRARS